MHIYDTRAAFIVYSFSLNSHIEGLDNEGIQNIIMQIFFDIIYIYMHSPNFHLPLIYDGFEFYNPGIQFLLVVVDVTTFKIARKPVKLQKESPAGCAEEGEQSKGN